MFDAPAFGQVVKTPGRHGYWAYHPEPLPKSFKLPPSTIMLLSNADRALGRLAGAGRLLPNPHLLISPFATREALASSRIEGTQASLSDVFGAQASNTSVGPILEVTNYVAALEHGLSRLTSLPVSKRLLCEVHAILLANVRGQEKRPGEIRSSQNWIGSADNRPETAVFVPPPPDEMKTSFDRLERYIHEPSQLPPLVEVGMIHYQFETIHPFLDGNGRLGRLLIAFLLVDRVLLPQPLLYLSAYFERHRSEYYDRLQAVREKGDMTPWLDFFLSGVGEQATEAVRCAEKLSDLRETYRARLSGSRSRAIEVVDLLFQNPLLMAGRVARELNVTNQSAINHLRRLQDENILHELSEFPGRSKGWVALEVLQALDPSAHIAVQQQGGSPSGA